MKNKVLLISLAVVLAVSLAVAGGCGVVCPNKVTVAMTRSISGPLANVHFSAFGAMYPVIKTYVNDTLGGITIDGSTFDMDIDERDDGSVPTNVISNANAIVGDIQAGSVHFMWGPTCTAFIDLVAPIANSGGCVLQTHEGGATFLKDIPEKLPSWPYVFVNLSFSDWHQLQVLGQMLVDESATNVYVCWQNDAHGLEYMSASEAILRDYYGCTITGDEAVLHTDPGFDPDAVVANINATTPATQVVCLFCYPDEILGITGAMIGANLSVEGVVGGPGANFGWFGGEVPEGAPCPPGFGKNAENVICYAVANNKTSNAGDPITGATHTMEWLYDTALGLPYWAHDPWGHPLYWAAFEIWLEAVEDVGTVDGDGCFQVDQDDFKDALASYNSSANSVATVLGPTWYTMFETVLGPGGGILAYECHTGEVGQWQDGYIEVVGYDGVENDLDNYRITANYTWPKGDWI